MNKLLSLTSCIIAGLFCTEAWASRPSYDYLQGQFVYQDLDRFNCSQTGLGLLASLTLDDQTFIQAGYDDVDGSRCGSRTLSLTGGLYSNYGDASVLFVSASLLDVNIDAGGSDSGFALSGGIRTLVDQGLEYNARLTYQDVDEGIFSLTGGIVYWTSDVFAIVGDITFSEDNDLGVGAGIRFHF